MAFLQKLSPLPSSSSFPSPSASHLLLLRHFQSIAPLAFKFKIRIKEQKEQQQEQQQQQQQQYQQQQQHPDEIKTKDSSGQERRTLTPLVDHGAVPPIRTTAPTVPTPDISTDPSTTPDASADPSTTPRRNADNVYQRNTRRKTVSKIATFKKMKTWPLVTASMNMLPDIDLPMGIKFSVAYHDTHAHVGHSGPIVLILHGFQLPAINFSAMISPLVDQGCRVIAPIFPLAGHTFGRANPHQVTTARDMPLFSHSTLERGLFVREFCEQLLPVGRAIDVVVAADVGSYPAVFVTAHPDKNPVKSLVLLDGFPGKPLPVMKPHLLFLCMSKLWEWRYYSILSWPFMVYLMNVFGSTSLKEASVHCRNVGWADFDAINGGLTTVEIRRIPAVVWASKKHKLVPARDAVELMFRLGIEDKNIVDLTEEGNGGGGGGGGGMAPFSTTTTALSSSPSFSSSNESAVAPTSIVDVGGDVVDVGGGDNLIDESIFERTLTHSCGRFFHPREQDEFGQYNRRYAKAGWYHMAGPVAKDISQLIKRVNSSQ